MSISVGQWRRSAISRLAALDPDDADYIANRLIEEIINKPLAWILTHQESQLDAAANKQLEEDLEQVLAGFPLPYVLAKWDFYGLEFKVNPSVLIPRPETEILVEEAVQWVKCFHSLKSAVDIGTGSGCIPISVLTEVEIPKMWAVDVSRKALQIARHNAVKHQKNHAIRFIQGDLLSAIVGPFQLITANLPYIPTDMLKVLDVARYEPQIALDGGVDGITYIQRLINQARLKIDNPGLMLLEIQFDQAERVAAFLATTLPGSDVRVLKDLAGLDRVIRVEVN